MTIIAHLGLAFLGFLIGTVVSCIVLVKKNGNKYNEISERVHNKRFASGGDESEIEDDDYTDDSAE